MWTPVVQSVPLSRAGTVSCCMRHHCRTRAQAEIQPRRPPPDARGERICAGVRALLPHPTSTATEAEVDLPSVGLFFLACFLKFSLWTVPVNFALLMCSYSLDTFVQDTQRCIDP